MVIGSNTLNELGEMINLDYDDDEVQVEEPVQEPEEDFNNQNSLSNAIDMLLKDKGIEDSRRIKFADDNNLIQERDWNTLSEDEKYNILAQQPTVEASDVSSQLTPEEIQLLNAMRQLNLSPSEFFNLSILQGVQNYINNQPEPSYSVDEFTDDDLYMGDLKIRTPNITDDELLQALEQAKQNPELFTKQILGLREEYKELEDRNREEEDVLNKALQQELYQQFADTIYNSIDALEGLGGIDIELEDDDRLELANFILGYDLAGVNYLQKALSNPLTLTQVAWFLLKGQDTIDGIVNYFTKEISKVRENSFKKGQESITGKPLVIITQPKTSTFSQSPINSIDDLD